MRHIKGLKQVRFYDLLGFSFNHNNGFFRAGNNQIQIALQNFPHIGIDHKRTGDPTDSYGGYRSFKRNVRYDKGGRHAYNAEDVRNILIAV